MFIGIGEAEVDQFKGAVEVDQQVLRLQIAMHNAQLMEILDPCNELSEVLTGFRLFETFLFDNEFEEFALRNVLHD